MRPKARVLIAAIAVLAALVSSPAAVGQDLDDVAARRQQLQDQLDAAATRLEQLRGRVAQLEDELATLNSQRAELETQAAQALDAIDDRVRTRFMSGTPSTFEAILRGDGPAEAAERARLVDLLTRRSVGDLEQARSLRVAIEQNAHLAAARRQELADAEARMEGQADALQAALEDAKQLEAAVRAREARKKQISRGAQQGTYACIFDRPYNFIDSWGFPRSGGRSHKGSDVMAPRGVNVYAFTSGRVGRLSSGGLGGNALRIIGDDGNRYYYAHLQDFAPGIRPGVRVEAGQLVAFNGSSGNAAGGAPHVHFQIQPGGGAPVNPYPWLRAACPR